MKENDYPTLFTFPKLLKIHKSLILVLLALPLLVAASSKQAFAATTSLSISPSILRIDTTSGSTITTPFRITNQSDQNITLYIIYKHFLPSDTGDGSMHFVSTNEKPYGKRPSLIGDSKILETDLPKDEITLAPRQEKKLTFNLSIPKSEARSDYYFSVLFLTKEEEQAEKIVSEEIKAVTNITTGIGMNVLLGINQDNKTDLIIDEFSAPGMLQHAPVPFTIRVRNDQNHFITPEATIRITNMFGKPVANLPVPIASILGNSKRQLGTPVIEWNEPILFGPYTATLMLSIPQGTITYTRSLRFVALPVIPLVILSGSILIILLILTKIKKK